MSINLSTFWTTWGVSSGDTSSTNQYDFWRGIIMDDNTQLSSQYDFFKYNNTTRYEFFNNLNSTYPEVWDEYTFYQNTNDARIYNFDTFYTYAAESLPGGGPPPAPYFTWQAEETITGECSFTTSDLNFYNEYGHCLIGNTVYSNTTLTTPFVGNPLAYYTIQLTGVDDTPRGYIQINAEGTITTSTSCYTSYSLTNSYETPSDSCGDELNGYDLFISDNPVEVGSNVYSQGEGGQNTGLATFGNDLWYKDINSLNSYQIMTDGSVGDIYTCPIPLSGSMSPISAYTNTNFIITGSSNYTGSTFIWDLTDFYETATDEPITSYTGNPLVEGYFTTSGSSNVNLTITAEGQTATTSNFNVYVEPPPVNMSGGTITTEVISGVTYRVHTFNSTGTLTVNQGGQASLLMVAGGGGGAGGRSSGGSGGGGGGGGQIYYSSINFTTGGTITIGNGGVGGGNSEGGSNGSDTTFSGLTAIAGGGGGAPNSGGSSPGNAGGNGGGGGCGPSASGPSAGGLGTAGQGNDGSCCAGNGGSSNGVSGYSIGGSGNGCQNGGVASGASGTANTGNGGGGAYGSVGSGGNGGSGVVKITYQI